MHPKLFVKREQTAKIYCNHYKKPSNTEFHFHSHIELYLVEEGEVDVWVGTRYRRLRAGDMAVMLSYDAHRYKVVGDARITYLIVPPSMCGELGSKALSLPFITECELFSNVSKCCNVISKSVNPLITEGCVSVVFGLLLETLNFTERRSAIETDGISRVLLYISNNFKNDISLSSVAGALGFNSSYLSRQFKDSVGIGFKTYVNMIRLREAVILLQKGESVSFCAYESGFNSLRSFYRAFGAEFGCTPKEYLAAQ